jgi:hypothetical protein
VGLPSCFLVGGVGHDPQKPTAERDEPRTNVAPFLGTPRGERSIVLSFDNRLALRNSTFDIPLRELNDRLRRLLIHGLPPRFPHKIERHGGPATADAG